MANKARVYRTGKKKNAEQTVCPVVLHRMLEGKTTLMKVTVVSTRQLDHAGFAKTNRNGSPMFVQAASVSKLSRRPALATNFTAEQIRSHVLS